MASLELCLCGAESIDSETTWTIGKDDDGDPASVGQAHETPVCYGMGPQRYDARDYLAHVLRLAINERRPTTLIAKIQAKLDSAQITTSPLRGR